MIEKPMEIGFLSFLCHITVNNGKAGAKEIML